MAAETAVDVVMPQMGVSVSEGTITKWLKQEGETIAADEPLLEISTDKVDTEVPSPGTGTLTQILVQEGETVSVGTRLAVIGGDEASPATPPEAPPEPATPRAADQAMSAAGESVPSDTVSQGSGDAAGVESPPRSQDSDAVATPSPPSDTVSQGAESSEGAESNGRSFVSPVVARIASEHGIDPEQVEGTGRGGRVTKKDILAFVESARAAPTKAGPEPTAPAPAETPPPQAEPAASAQPPQAGERIEPELQIGETLEPMTAMRRGIAEHMRRSLDTAAHVTSAIEVDMSKVVAIRARLKDEYRAGHGVNLTYLAFVARATIETLRDWPWVNGEIRGEKILTRQFVNLGIAVALADGKGLIVPVIRNAQDLNLLGIARAIGDLAQRAREKKLMPDDVQGGTFTITNPGGFGTFHGTPIINQPQAAILGTYALVKRPWVVEDELGQDVIAIRSIMNITLTYDHRLVDGAYAAQFLQELQERLETWEETSS